MTLLCVVHGGVQVRICGRVRHALVHLLSVGMCSSKEIRGNQPDRPYGDGRAHHSCIKAQNRCAVATRTPIPRSKRPYDTLRPFDPPSLRQSRRLAAHSRPSHHHLLRLLLIFFTCRPQSASIRTVPSLRIPCERTIIECKKQLANTHTTETGTFASGAYVTDPVRFVSVLCVQSPFIAVGGDAGGGRCVL